MGRCRRALSRGCKESVMTDLPHDLLDPTQQLALDEHEHVDQRACEQCGLLFAPRAHSGGSQQRFCSAECRLAFHAKGQRGQRVPACSAPEKSPATSRPTSESEASEADDGFVLMEQQDFIEIAWDEHGDLLLR